MRIWSDTMPPPPRWLIRISYGVLGLLGAFGAFAIVNYAIGMHDRNELIKNGERVPGVITKAYRQRCGGGYGYTAEFIYTAGRKQFVGKCMCESRDWVKVGDQFPVVFSVGDTEKAVMLIGDP
jgi:hypothetical protein